jgi:hypothetical protein
MKKKRIPTEIIQEINSLLSELANSLGGEIVRSASSPLSIKKTSTFSGPSGGIKLLLGENFFKEPKTLPEVCARLRQEGFNYSRQAVSVALLRLVRDRTMVRIPATGDGKEKWVYAERK